MCISNKNEQNIRMNQNKSETFLSYFYPLIIVCGFVCSITSAIAWNHWKYVLDTCVERNCGCILNGVSTITYFTGGHIAYCHYVTFALLLSTAVAIIFGSYHVWRMCMAKEVRKTSRHSIRQRYLFWIKRFHASNIYFLLMTFGLNRSGEMIIMTAQSEVDEDGISPKYWLVTSVVSGFMILYTLIHVIIYIDGAWQSCHQYRNELIKYMHATGTLVNAVKGRISCNAVFDFM